MRGWWSLPAAALLLSACAGDGDQQPSAELEQATKRQARVPAEALEAALTTLLAPQRPPDSSGLSAADWKALKAHYQARAHRPIFVDGHGPREEAKDFLAALCEVEEDGLEPADFDLAPIQDRLEQVQGSPHDAALLATAELELAILFVHFGHDLAGGRLLPHKTGWNLAGRGLDAAGLLATLDGDASLEEALTALRPPHPEYQQLREALAAYRELEATGGWPQVPEGKTLEPGATDPRVPVLRERLEVTGELEASPAGDPNHYDPEVVEAVKRFQRRHGLEPDGRVGGATLASLRVPVSRRVAQLVANLERWRWMPADLGERAVLINVPAFELEARQAGKTVQRMRVIVGLPEWSTPVFASAVEAVIFQPRWYVPSRILAKDILPKLQEDAEFVNRAGLKVFSAEDGQEVDPATVDWASLDAEVGEVPFRFQQPPGEDNPLGRVKFTLPNRYAIYLHDTPNEKLFGEAARAYSHGCIRVERPAELAAFILAGTEGWEDGAIREQFEAQGKTRHVKPASPPRVYTTYFTAFVDDEGVVQFRDDLYRWDWVLLKKLKERHQQPEEALPLCG